MTTIVAPPAALRPRPQVCRACGTLHQPAPVAICEQCLGPLDPVVDAARVLPSRDAIAARPWSLWRYREWLPFDGDPVLSLDTGGTPLVEAPRLAARLGVARVWVKNDAVSHPSLSFKDRVVATAINAAAAFGLDTIGCASTGNLANAVAAHAARAGLTAWIFIPEELETAKVVGTSVHGARLVRVRGTYDDVNRLCAQVADRFGWGIVNVNLRAYYGEGSKTVAHEIAEQLGWRLGRGGERSGAGRGDPLSGRGYRCVRRDGGRCHGGGRARPGTRGPAPTPGRSGALHHGTRLEDARGGAGSDRRGSGHRAAAARGDDSSRGGTDMAITLNLPSVLAAHTGGARTIEASGRTLGEAVADVAARFPALAPRLRDKDGKPYPFVNFYLNDEDVRFRGGFAAPVQDGDEVTVIPAIAGG